MACQDCKYFSALTSECRKNPPVPVMIAGRDGPHVLGMFPATRADQWCGAFECLGPINA